MKRSYFFLSFACVASMLVADNRIDQLAQAAELIAGMKSKTSKTITLQNANLISNNIHKNALDNDTAAKNAWNNLSLQKQKDIVDYGGKDAIPDFIKAAQNVISLNSFLRNIESLVNNAKKSGVLKNAKLIKDDKQKEILENDTSAKNAWNQLSDEQHKDIIAHGGSDAIIQFVFAAQDTTDLNNFLADIEKKAGKGTVITNNTVKDLSKSVSNVSNDTSKVFKNTFQEVENLGSKVVGGTPTNEDKKDAKDAADKLIKDFNDNVKKINFTAEDIQAIEDSLALLKKINPLVQTGVILKKHREMKHAGSKEWVKNILKEWDNVGAGSTFGNNYKIQVTGLINSVSKKIDELPTDKSVAVRQEAEKIFRNLLKNISKIDPMKDKKILDTSLEILAIVSPALMEDIITYKNPDLFTSIAKQQDLAIKAEDYTLMINTLDHIVNRIQLYIEIIRKGKNVPKGICDDIRDAFKYYPAISSIVNAAKVAAKGGDKAAEKFAQSIESTAYNLANLIGSARDELVNHCKFKKEAITLYLYNLTRDRNRIWCEFGKLGYSYPDFIIYALDKMALRDEPDKEIKLVDWQIPKKYQDQKYFKRFYVDLNEVAYFIKYLEDNKKDLEDFEKQSLQSTILNAINNIVGYGLNEKVHDLCFARSLSESQKETDFSYASQKWAGLGYGDPLTVDDDLKIIKKYLGTLSDSDLFAKAAKRNIDIIPQMKDANNIDELRKKVKKGEDI